MVYELEGTVKLVGEVQSFGAKGFQKRDLVVTVEDGKYPQDIALELHSEKTELGDGLAIGSQVKVAFNIRGREYNGRYFNNLVAWKLETLGGVASGNAAPQQATNEDIPF